jgi:hypothetical protein
MSKHQLDNSQQLTVTNTKRTQFSALRIQYTVFTSLYAAAVLLRRRRMDTLTRQNTHYIVCNI